MLTLQVIITQFAQDICRPAELDTFLYRLQSDCLSDTDDGLHQTQAGRFMNSPHKGIINLRYEGQPDSAMRHAWRRA